MSVAAGLVIAIRPNGSAGSLCDVDIDRQASWILQEGSRLDEQVVDEQGEWAPIYLIRRSS